jgi:hypothetical protein
MLRPAPGGTRPEASDDRAARTRCDTPSSPLHSTLAWPYATSKKPPATPTTRTTMRYDRARVSLDRHATYIVSTFIAGAAR